MERPPAMVLACGAALALLIYAWLRLFRDEALALAAIAVGAAVIVGGRIA